jgi:hypothetical protein
MNRECAAVMTSTGSSAVEPSSSGILLGGNHRSHCVASPGSQINRFEGSTGVCSGRSRHTFSRDQVIDPVQPTRSATTVGGRFDANARSTVDLPIARSRATRPCGTPSATSRRIRAQSSTEITNPICLGGLVRMTSPFGPTVLL